MCPECFASAAMIVAGVVSASGVTALVLNNLRGRKSVSYESSNQSKSKGEGNEPDNESEDRIAQ
jgi:hypothetical protein